MEKNREVRRASMSTRRRHRITGLRDSSDRDREVLNENKRMRVERFAVQKRCSRDEEKGSGDVDSTDESFNNGEEDDDRRISPSSSSITNHSHRRYITPARGAVRSPSVFRITDEMVIGVPVPRKARSASAKRSHENLSFFEHQSHRKFSSVTVDGGLDGASHSSSSGSLRNKKMKSGGIKTRFRVPSTSPKSSSLIQDDIEMEVAEALFDLMKQSQSHSQSKSESSNVNKAADDKSCCSPADIVGANGTDVENGKEAVSIQNGLITEIKAHNEEVSKKEVWEKEMERCLMKPKSLLSERIIAQRIELKKEESVGKEKDSNDGSVGGDMVVTKEEEESRPCAKSNADNPANSASSKANPAAKVIEKKRESKFEIDLMAAPLMPSSPEGDGLIDHPQVVVQDVQMKSEMLVSNEDKMVGKGQEEKKMETGYFNRESSMLDLEMAYQENVGTGGGMKPQQEGEKEPNQCQPAMTGGQKIDQPSSLTFPIAGNGWPTSLPRPGCMPPLQIVMPVDGSARSLTALQQPPPFSLSKPRPKRCATHQYIARNIRCHQQLTEQSTWPAAAATLIEGKPHNLNPSLSAQNVIIGNTSQGDFPGRQTLTMVSGLRGKDKISGAATNVDATNSKQLMLQQGLQQVPTANMLLQHGQAMIFQLGQHHASTAPPTSQPGPPKSAPAVGNAGMPSNSSGGAPVSSSASPAGTATVNFTHAHMPASPYMAMFQNNGYPFSFSTSIGAPPTTGAQAPVMPFLNGSYYSSPMFHISQSQPQQFSQPQVQTSPYGTSKTNGLSSQVQPHCQPQMGAQISHNTYFPPKSMLLQQSHKQGAPPSESAGKLAAENNQKNDPLISNSGASHSQKSTISQNLVIPVQPINLAYMTPGTPGGNMGATSSNHGEQQQQDSKGGYQLMPPQAFGLSFSSTASSTPVLNFSSMVQNPAVFQLLPDMGRQVYQFAPGSRMTQHKNFQMSEGKIVVGSISNTEERKGIFGDSPASASQSRNGSKSSCTEPSTSSLMGTAVIDSSGRTVSFLQLPVSGSQTFPSSSTLPTTVVSASPSNSQRQHQQLTGIARCKQPNSDAISCTFITSNSPNNNPVFSQNLIQTTSSAQSSHLKYLPSSQVSSPFNASSRKDISQQQLNHPQSQTHIAFGSSTANISTASQGQQHVINHHSAASLVGGSPSNSISKETSGNSRTAPTASKSGPTSAALPSQQIETSRSTPSQKSSPVCGRNVPSILSTSPCQLSELKY